MWSLFGRRRDLDAEAYAKLRPGDLYGGEDRPPEVFVHYLLLMNAPMLTFFAVLGLRVGAETPARAEFVTAVWLTGMGMAIAIGAWTALRLSRSGEAKAVAADVGRAEASELPPPIRAMMKRAAIKKMLAFRLMLVSGISGFIGLYSGLKGLVIL